MIMTDGKLIWIDLETTGLDQDNEMSGCRNHSILEIGLHITDDRFNILDEGLQIAIHHLEEVILSHMSDFVKDMHTKNGLLEDVKKSKLLTPAVDSMVCSYLKSHNVVEGESPICGNNVGFDKNFIAAQMPMLTRYLHYRKLDVSSFKEVAKRVCPEAFHLVQQFKDGNSNHRALDDIKASIREMQIYLDHMLKYTA
jgi:oligoribonuclease